MANPPYSAETFIEVEPSFTPVTTPFATVATLSSATSHDTTVSAFSPLNVTFVSISYVLPTNTSITSSPLEILG